MIAYCMLLCFSVTWSSLINSRPVQLTLHFHIRETSQSNTAPQNSAPLQPRDRGDLLNCCPSKCRTLAPSMDSNYVLSLAAPNTQSHSLSFYLIHPTQLKSESLHLENTANTQSLPCTRGRCLLFAFLPVSSLSSRAPFPTQHNSAEQSAE